MDHIIVFVKNPQLGKVKTRLAASVGDTEALSIYLVLLGITKDIVLPIDANLHVFYSAFIDENDIWPNDKCIKHLQLGSDLGEKMSNAFNDVFTTCDANTENKVLIIGSDCPEIRTEILRSAFDTLDTHDVVCGPSLDGGYYLLGMKNPHKALFENISWSTDTVLTATVEKIILNNLSFQFLDTLNDIDTIDDWKRYQAGISNA